MPTMTRGEWVSQLAVTDVSQKAGHLGVSFGPGRTPSRIHGILHTRQIKPAKRSIATHQCS